MDDGAGGVEGGGPEVESGGAHLGALERQDWDGSQLGANESFGRSRGGEGD